MKNKSKRVSLLLLGATALICSRAWFWFLHDPEGPNLLIVTGLALVLYILSLTVYLFDNKPADDKKLLAALLIQVLVVTVLYVFLT